MGKQLNRVLQAARSGLACAWPILTSERRALVDSAEKELRELEAENEQLKRYVCPVCKGGNYNGAQGPKSPGHDKRCPVMAAEVAAFRERGNLEAENERLGRMAESAEADQNSDALRTVADLRAKLEAAEAERDRPREFVGEVKAGDLAGFAIDGQKVILRNMDLQADLAAAREQLAEWEDPDSAKRQALLEETVFNLGEGNRSEIELREGQLELAEVRIAELEADVALVRLGWAVVPGATQEDLRAARIRTDALLQGFCDRALEAADVVSSDPSSDPETIEFLEHEAADE